jgi:serine/threonine protein kinase
MSTLEPGQIFERYRILQWLGHGVSGESYEAEDTMLPRKVTLKLIHPQTTLPDSVRRQFFREMQGISILNHPYLATVLDYGEIDGKLYVARRYSSNGSFLGSNGRLWFRSPLDVSEAIQYGHQLAQALQHIHNRGYVHGAFTFSNILVLGGPSLENQANYAPFLLADVGLTNFVRRFGQQLHMPLPVTAAPEQLGKRVTAASDQFALAVVLYFWLAGGLPYVGTPQEIEHLKLTETIIPLSSLNARVSVEQEEMVRRALSVYPEDRYPTVLAFTDALLETLAQSVIKTEQSAQTGIEMQAVPESTPECTTQIVADVPQSLPAPLAQAEFYPVEQLSFDQEHLSEMQAEPAETTAYLIIISPYIKEPYQVLLRGDETTIGRAGSSGILLEHDNLTSRHHALLKRENGRYFIYDRGSGNGVQVNGQWLSDNSGCALKDGDHIGIGNYELIFYLGAPQVTGEGPIFATNNSTVWS